MNSVTYGATARKVPHVGVAYLLSQVGAHAADAFEERLFALKLKPHHAGLLRMLGVNPGLSQQELCDLFGVFPSRLVVLLDQLEVEGLIERRDNPSDRRGHRLQLTKAGRATLKTIGRLTVELENDLCASLSDVEKATLLGLLARIVSQQKITPAVHPAYRRLREGRGGPGVESRPPSRKRKRGT